MRFGRVEGFGEVVRSEVRDRLHLRVILETAQGLVVVRDDVVPLLEVPGVESPLTWQVDQYTQETIGVDLATEGWEVIGAGELPTAGAGEIARSASYAVRQL
jgi:hypothetical protein